jgi:D-hydroxyproline dehydrogenase subunit beta
MTPHFDVAVIGGGIVGLAHAWMAARRRLRVILLERSAAAEGASVRNFGMIWPIGQPEGELHEIALRSRELWLELNSLGVVPAEECGSIHLAHHGDELAVQEEFCNRGSHGAKMLTAEQSASRSLLINSDNLIGGMFSSTELRVNPRTASAVIARWLQSQGMACCFRTTVTSIENRLLRASDGRSWRADRIIICSGSDLQTLYPDILGTSGIQLCKLQMLKATAQPDHSPGTPHLASGLTLRHYAAFRECPSLHVLQQRVQAETPELDQYGIHVMASQLASGEVILGDSHQYDREISPFDNSQIDDLILREARKVFRLADWTIRERWSGIYAKHPQQPLFETVAGDGTSIFVGTGGAGMTMSFGLAERAWKSWRGEV